ncbi:MAG: cache domain-containing protein, partial [Halanaerobacter sp.]
MNLFTKLRNVNIKKKLLLLFLGIGILFVVGGGLVGQSMISDLRKDTLEKQNQELKKELDNALAAKEKVWLTNSLQIASNPMVQEAMANEDRETAIQILNNYSQKFKENSGFNNINVHLIDKNLNSFVKSWAPDDFGENLDFSDAYQKVKSSQESLVVTEESPKGLRLKALFPIYDEGEFVGIVNFDGGLNSIKRTLSNSNVEFLYFLHNDYLDIAQGIKDKAQLGDYTLSQKDINQDCLSAALENADLEQLEDGYQFSENYLLTTQKIESAGGEEVGLYLLARRRNLVTESINQSKNLIYMVSGIFLVIFIIQILLVYIFVNKSINHPIKKVQSVLNKVANNDLSSKVDVKSEDEIGQMGRDLNDTIDQLSNLLRKIKSTALNVNNGAGEISEGNQDLSQRTQEQSSSLEEVSATIEEITSSIQNAAVKSGAADDLSNETMEAVDHGSEVVEETMDSMEEVSESSSQISEIITTVNDIAFQTNLLALN